MAVIILFIVVIAFSRYINSKVPMLLTAESLNAGQIKIYWNTVDNAQYYNIYRMDKDSGKFEKIDAAWNNSYVDCHLEASSSYLYKISAVRYGVEGQLSMAIQETTKVLPGIPSGITTDTAGSDSIVIKWDIVDEADKYYIYRDIDDNDVYIKIAESVHNSFDDMQIIDGAKHSYKITSINKNGESQYSDPLEIVTETVVNLRGNRGNNLVNGGHAAEQGGWIYFTDKSVDHRSLCKVRKDGTGFKRIYGGYISNINVIGDWIYYSESSGISKIKTDGSSYTVVHSSTVFDFSIIGEWIYYSADGIYKMKTDGSESRKICNDKAVGFNIEGEWIYYSNINDKNKLYKIRVDGSSRRRMTSEAVGFINVTKDWIYYKSFDHKDNIYRIKSDGTRREKVLDYEVNMFNAAEDKILFENWGDGGALYMTDINGNNLVKLTDGHYNSISIIGDIVLCYNFETKEVMAIELNSNSVDGDEALA
jgi:hypothetical protein